MNRTHDRLPVQNHGLPRSAFWMLQVGGWITFAGAVSIGRIGEFSLATIVVLDWALAALGFVATLVLGALYSRLRIRGSSLVRILGVVVLSSYVAASCWTASYHLYLGYAASPLLSVLSGEWVSLGRHLAGPREILDNNIYNTLVLLAWSMLYVGIDYHRAMQEEREQRLRAEAHAHQARLRALRFQLNPHFLFNSLNAISTLVLEKREQEATGMLSRLGEFLRLTMEGDGLPEVALAEELEFVRRYLEIEQVRFGERLNASIHAEDEVLDHSVPSLILQPLVENAIKHAISPREDGGRIAVEARREHKHLLLRVTDDGPGLRAVQSPGPGGVGLVNTRERLNELYGQKHSMDLEEAEGGGLAVCIRIPLRAAGTLVGAGAA